MIVHLALLAVRSLTEAARCRAGVDSSLHNYVLLGLALFQFPFMYYLGIRPPIVAAGLKGPIGGMKI